MNYVGKAGNIYAAGYELDGSAYVISKCIGTTWLWDRVRVSGGAYGGFCDFDSHSGLFCQFQGPTFLYLFSGVTYSMHDLLARISFFVQRVN